MTATILGDPDVFVQWEKVDEPGENPTWISQCGRIEETTFGDTPTFQGYVGPQQIPTSEKFTLASAKSAVEATFKKTHTLKWAYDGYQS